MSFNLNFNYIQTIISVEEEEEYQGNDNQKGEQVSSLKDLTERLVHLQSCNDFLTKRGMELQRAITDLEIQESVSHELSTKIKALSDCATLFNVAASAVIKVSSD